MKKFAFVFMALGMLFMFQPAATAVMSSSNLFETIENNDGDPEKCKKCDKCKEGKCDAECKAKCEKEGCKKEGTSCTHKGSETSTTGESKCASKCSSSATTKSCCKKTPEEKK